MLKCTTCQGELMVLHREIEGGDVGLDTPLFLSYLTNDPCGGRGGQYIILIEHGTLAELVSVFLEITKAFAIPAGTVVLLASASHKATASTAEYATGFVKANKK